MLFCLANSEAFARESMARFCGISQDCHTLIITKIFSTFVFEIGQQIQIGSSNKHPNQKLPNWSTLFKTDNCDWCFFISMLKH